VEADRDSPDANLKMPVHVLLMVRELNIGGTERQCAEMARSLDRTRYFAHVGCFRPSGFRAEELTRAEVPVLHLPVDSLASFSAARGAKSLRDYIRSHGIKIVHTFDFPMNLYAAPLARAFQVPVVLTSQRQSRDLYPRIRSWLRMTDRLADGIVVNCEALRREMIEQDGAPSHKVLLCYNGLDATGFPVRNLERPSEILTIGVLCALRPEKDLMTLVNAFHRVRDMRAGLRLLIVGQGVLREPLEQRVRELNLTAQCHFEPATADVPGWMRQMDIFVLPSRSEALSNSLMEAMATACAPVASRVGGNPELVDGERTGLLFKPGDDADLAECLRRLILNDGLRRSLALAASERMRREFSLESAAGRLAEIYDERLRMLN
jgi:glycosyltransferase involved in cell wall biosynthesis